MKKNPVNSKNINTILLVLFFLSGFASLTYELVWIRILSVVFGKTISAVTIVVSVYMAGLGLGSIYWGRRIDKYRNHLRIFSILQFAIGISSLFILLLFSKLPEFYKYIYHIFNVTPKSSQIFIFLISFLFMLVPTLMMGGTLPVISKCYVKSDQEIGRGIGILYAINTLGGIIGAGLTGYFLIGSLGQTLTQLFAVLINCLLGLVSFFLSSNEERSYKEEKAVEAARYKNYILKFSLVVAGLSGFCSLAFEILSMRALGIFLLNSTYSFSSILIIFLLGISIGSFIYTKFLGNKKRLLFILALSQAVIGLYIIVTVTYLNNIPTILFPLQNSILKIPLLKIVLPGLLLSTVLLFIPTVFMGIGFPILCKIYTTSIRNIGANIGKVYFVNTLGGIIGPLVAGFVLIPFLGVAKGMLIIAFINLLVGTVLLLLETDLKNKTIFLIVNLSLIITGIFFTNIGIKRSMIHPPSIFRTQTRSDAILYYKETTEGTVIVREDKNTGIRSLYVNNSAACGVTYDALKVVKMLGHLPFLINPIAQDVLIIGFGVGITTSAVARHRVRSIDCVEICPGVKEAAQYFRRYNNNILSNPKVTFIGGDGRNHLLLTNNKYDIISCDPIHPTLGCGNLYTREYFQLCKSHLTEDGVVSQYLPLHQLSLKEFKALIKTFHSVFPHTSVWLAHSHCILLGSTKSVVINFRFIKEFLRTLNDDLLNDPYRMSTSLFLDKDAVEAFTREAIIHTDDRSFLEYFTPLTRKKENWHINLSAMMKFRIDPSDLITNIDNQEKMARYLIGQEFFLNGLIYKTKGEIRKALTLFKNALEINPENSEIKLFFKNELKQYRLLHKIRKQNK